MGTVHAKSEDFTPQSLGERNVNITPPPDRQPAKDLNLEGLTARVDKISIDGLSRTKDDIVQDCIQELFKARDFQDVLIKAHRARVKLDELGCFKNIAIFIDTSKGPNATDNGLEVTFNVKEHKRVTGGISTHVGNNEGALLVGMKAPNLFGRGERVQVEYSHGSKRTSNFNLAFIKPFRGTNRPLLTTSIFQANSEWPSSGYKQIERGVLLDLGFYSLPLVKHNIQWEGNIRDLSVLSRTTAFEIREQSGLSLKSSLRHILSMDLRDDVIFPSQGSFLTVNTEFAGLGGNVGFFKNDIFLQTNYSLWDDIVLQSSLSGGYMNGLNNDMKISMSDMYFLGGPLSLRGFQMRGVGPHADGDALGQSAYWAAGFHIFTPLPFRPGRGGFGELFRTHFFLNAGNIGDFKLEPGENSLDVLKRNMRVSYGLGVALRLGNVARLEVNYCFPISYEKSDQAHPGVQFGIGVNFL